MQAEGKKARGRPKKTIERDAGADVAAPKHVDEVAPCEGVDEEKPSAAVSEEPAVKKRGRKPGSKSSQDSSGADVKKARKSKKADKAAVDMDEERDEERDEDGDGDGDGAEAASKRRKRRPRAKLNVKATLKNYIEYLKQLPDEHYEALQGKYLSTFGFEGVYQHADLVSEERLIDEVIDWKKSPSQMHEIARIFEEACRRGVRPAGIASMCTEGKKLEKKFKTGDIEGRVYVGQFFAMFRNEECMKQYFDKEKQYPFAALSKVKVYENPLQALDDELCA